MTNKISKGRLTAFFICQLTAAAALTSCSDWDDHYDATEVHTADGITIYNGDIVSYLKAADDLKTFSAMLQQAGVFDETYADKEYTFIVSDDNLFPQQANADAQRELALYSVSDMAVPPTLLKDGTGILTRSGKNVWVHGSGDNLRLDDYAITKTVKTSNGYIYYIGGVLAIRRSVYDYFLTLGDEYSRFKEIVGKYEQPFFDREHSAVIGVNEAGQTVYDTTWVVRNTLLDRYTADGVEQWNIHSESYMTTMFVPTNDQIDKALSSALDSIPAWLNREATDADAEKFEQWIVKACFADRQLTDADVAATAPDFETSAGYVMVIDELADETSYVQAEPAWWRPAVQTVDATRRVDLSNGSVYFTTNFKIPNHVIIYRVKSRFYELWNAMTPEEQAEYFRWNHFINPMIVNDAQGEFQLSASLPTIYYHVLTAIPDADAIGDSLNCSVDYDGLTAVTDARGNVVGVTPCNLPAGEYYLRMGFVHSLTYTLDIYFNGTPVTTGLVMNAHGADYHFDRSGASDITAKGIWQAAYPEGYNPADWVEINENASAYDTDGYTIGIVNMAENGNFHITVSSPDIGYLYTTNSRTKNDKNQLMMYHWCLRPTHNNY